MRPARPLVLHLALATACTEADGDGASSGPAESTGAPATGTATGPGGSTGGLDTSAGAADSSTGEDADAIAVAVGYGTQTVRSSDGRTWTDIHVVDPQGGDDENVLRGVGYGDGTFVAVGGAALGFSLRSLDGITWTDENRTLTSFVSDVAHVGGVFVAAGGNGLRVRSLDGGVTWQDPAEGLSAHFRAIASNGEVAVAIGSSYGGDPIEGVRSSTAGDGTWSAPVQGGSGYASIAAGGGVFVALDYAGVAHVSSDGTTWQDADVALPGGDHRVIHAAGMFVTDGEGGYWTSSDGTTWQMIAAAEIHPPVAYIAGTYLSIASPGLLASGDLQAWDPVYTAVASGLNDVATGAPGG